MSELDITRYGVDSPTIAMPGGAFSYVEFIPFGPFPLALQIVMQKACGDLK